MEEEMIKNLRRMVPGFMKMARRMWLDYDDEADVLYISFEKPQNADDSIMDGDIVFHKRDGKVVGLTVLNVSKLG